MEFRKIVREELERIKSGREELEKIAKEIGCILVEEKEFTSFQYPEDCSEDKRNEIDRLFEEENLSKYGITHRELESSNQIVSYLSELLGEKEAA